MSEGVYERWHSPSSATKRNLLENSDVQMDDAHGYLSLSTYGSHRESTSQPLPQPEVKVRKSHSASCNMRASTVVENKASNGDETPSIPLQTIDLEIRPALERQVEDSTRDCSQQEKSSAAHRGEKCLAMQSLPGPVHPSHMLHLGLMSIAFGVPFDRAIIAYKHAENILRADLAPYTHRVLDLVAMDGRKHAILPSQMIRTIKELTARDSNGTKVERDDLSGWTQLMAVLERGLRARSVLRLGTLKVYIHHEAAKARDIEAQKDGSSHISRHSLGATTSQYQGDKLTTADETIRETHFACPLDVNNAVASAYDMKRHKERYRRWRNQGKRLQQISETIGLGLLVVAGSRLEKILADNQTSKGQVAIFVHCMQRFFPKVMHSARIFDHIAARLPDLLVKGTFLDREAEIDLLVRKGIDGTRPTTGSAQKANPDVLSIVRDIEDSERSLTPSQAVKFADPFFDAIRMMCTALRGLDLGNAHEQARVECDPAYEIMPARHLDHIGTEWPVLLRSCENGHTGGAAEHESIPKAKPRLTPVLSNGQWWITTYYPGGRKMSLVGGQDVSSKYISNVN